MPGIHALIIKNQIKKLKKEDFSRIQPNATYDKPEPGHEKFQGFTPLAIAVVTGNTQAIEFLLKQKEVSAITRNGKANKYDKHDATEFSPLQLAIIANASTKIISALLEKDTDKVSLKAHDATIINHPLIVAINRYTSTKNEEKLTALATLKCLLSYVTADDLCQVHLSTYKNNQFSFLVLLVGALPFETLQTILQRCQINMTDSRIATYAAMSGRVDILEKLVAAGTDLNKPVADGQAFAGENPLNIATRNEKPDVVHFLIKHKSVKLDYYNQASYCTGTPLQIAAFHGYFDIVKLLVDAGADIDHVYQENIANKTILSSAIIDAAQNKHEAIALYLLDKTKNKNPNIIPDEQVIQTRLAVALWSIENKNLNLFNALISKSVIPDINAIYNNTSIIRITKDKTLVSGIQLLQCAIVQANEPYYIETLVKHGANIDEAATKSFYKDLTPLSLAIMFQKVGTFATLIKCGADPYRPATAGELKGKCAIDIAIDLDNESFAIALINAFAKIKPSESEKVSLQQKNNLLESAISQEHVRLATLLLKMGAHVTDSLIHAIKALQNDNSNLWKHLSTHKEFIAAFTAVIEAIDKPKLPKEKTWEDLADANISFFVPANTNITFESVQPKVLQHFYRDPRHNSIFLHHANYEVEELKKILDENKEEQANKISCFYRIMLHLMRLAEAILKYVAETKNNDLYPRHMMSVIRNAIMHTTHELDSSNLIVIAEIVAQEIDARIKLFLDSKNIDMPIKLKDHPIYKKWETILAEKNAAVNANQLPSLTELAPRVEAELIRVIEATSNIHNVYALKLAPKNANWLRMQFTVLGEQLRSCQKLDQTFEQLKGLSFTSDCPAEKLSQFARHCKEIRRKMGHEFSENSNAANKMSNAVSVEYVYNTLKLAQELGKTLKPEAKALITYQM